MSSLFWVLFVVTMLLGFLATEPWNTNATYRPASGFLLFLALFWLACIVAIHDGVMRI